MALAACPTALHSCSRVNCCALKVMVIQNLSHAPVQAGCICLTGDTLRLWSQ